MDVGDQLQGSGLVLAGLELNEHDRGPSLCERESGFNRARGLDEPAVLPSQLAQLFGKPAIGFHDHELRAPHGYSGLSFLRDFADCGGTEMPSASRRRHKRARKMPRSSEASV